MVLKRVQLKWYYDENRIFPIEIVCSRRKTLFTIFKDLFPFKRYSSFYDMKIS